jgi:RecB family exonuclease
VLHVPDPAGPEARIGTMAHDVLEAVSRLGPGERTPEAALAASKSLWEGDTVGHRRAAWGHVMRGLRLLAVSHGDVVAVEREVNVTIGGVPFKGRVDRIDEGANGSVTVMDYKTGKRSTGRNNEYLAPKKRQVMLYAAAIEAADKRKVTEASVIWTAKGVVDWWEVNDIEIAKAVRWFRRVWEALTASLGTGGSFPAQVGPLCSWCPAVKDCPEGMVAVAERAAGGKAKVGQHGADALLTKALEDSVEAIEGK